MKFIFVCKHADVNGNKVEIQHTFEGEQLSDVLNAFQFFLKGVSFHFDGEVDIVNETNDQPESNR